MRRSELLGLRWRDVSWDPPKVAVTQTLVSVGYKLSFGEPKSHRSGRPVGIDAQTAAVLRAWRARQAEEKVALGASYNDQGLVFATATGEPIHPDRMSQAFGQHAKAAGLPPLPLHGLRHSHASTLLEAGVHPKIVQERLGHSSVSFTLDVYSHLGATMDEETAEKAAALVFGLDS